ncbi:MAG: cytochrome c biogenesis protein DipZ [Gemmatimonadaceae bacterium]|nr:cytochrome c biogenesis protein DipZ [Gemmatimonadaceae bacterium]
MTAALFLLAFAGGVLTIASPCILPVIPLIFSRAGRPVVREAVPLLLGIAIAFTFAAIIGTAAAHWVLVASELGRILALMFMGIVGLSLLSSRVAEVVTRPFTRAGAALLAQNTGEATPARNLVIGLAVGLLWAPCAGPILGLLIAGAAKTGGVHSAGLYFTFALGAAMSLGLLLNVGGRVMKAIRNAGAAERMIRRGLGIATIATVVALAFGWDSALFAKATIVNTASAESRLVDRLAPGSASTPEGSMSLEEFAAIDNAVNLNTGEGTLQNFDGATEWINSAPLTPAALKGKVVLVEFWTFACYNCLNALPHVKALEAKYRDKGLVVIGVHTPEVPHERVVANVREQVKRLGITYPVVIDNDYKIWKAYHNQYWPAAYYADANGKIRFHHFGEGRYEEQDKVVAKLLAEATMVR